MTRSSLDKCDAVLWDMNISMSDVGVDVESILLIGSGGAGERTSYSNTSS